MLSRIWTACQQAASASCSEVSLFHPERDVKESRGSGIRPGVQWRGRIFFTDVMMSVTLPQLKRVCWPFKKASQKSILSCFMRVFLCLFWTGILDNLFSKSASGPSVIPGCVFFNFLFFHPCRSSPLKHYPAGCKRKLLVGQDVHGVLQSAACAVQAPPSFLTRRSPCRLRLASPHPGKVSAEVHFLYQSHIFSSLPDVNLKE